MTTAFHERLTRLEREVRRIDLELAEIRLELGAEPELEPEPEPVRLPEPEPLRSPEPEPFALPAAATRSPRRELDLSVLFGAKSLAWVGGAVTLLGVVFFYVLAVNRGWIGPEVRIALRGLASSAVVGVSGREP